MLRKYRDTIQLVVSGHVHKWIDFAHTYGPQHYIMAATRYDPNAYMLLEIDRKMNTWRFINARPGGVVHTLQQTLSRRLNIRRRATFLN